MASNTSGLESNEKEEAPKKRFDDAKALLQKAKEQSAMANSEWKDTVDKAAAKLKTHWQFTPEELAKPREVIDALWQDVGCVQKYYQDSDASSLSDEKLIARVDAGSALYGINLINPTTFGNRGSLPLLAAPRSCPLLAPSLSSSIVSTKFTSVTAVNNFIESIHSAGLTVALNVNGFFKGVGGQLEGSHSSETASTQKKQTKETSCSLYQVELHNMVKKAFRLSIDSMKLSIEAVDALKQVTSLPKAREFLNKFQSHINSGIQHLGGIFICKTKFESQTAIDVEMLEEASAKFISGSAGISCFRLFGVGASGKSVEVKASKTGNESSLHTVHVSREIESFGPLCKLADFFQQALDASNADWHITDRGKFESFTPVWEIIQRLYPANEDKVLAARLLRKAWLDMASTVSHMPLVQAEIDRIAFTHLTPSPNALNEVPLNVQTEVKKVDDTITQLIGSEFNPISTTSMAIRNTMLKITELIQRLEYQTGLDLLPNVMKSGLLPNILGRLAVCEDQAKIKDVLSVINQLFSTEVMQKLDQMRIEVPFEVMNLIRQSRPSSNTFETSGVAILSEPDYLKAVPLQELPAQLENILNMAVAPSATFKWNLAAINSAITTCLSRSLSEADSPIEMNNRLIDFGWSPSSHKLSRTLDDAELRSLISVIRHVLSPPAKTTQSTPLALLKETSQIQIPTGVFSDESPLYHHNDWLVNRPMCENLSPVVRFIDVLRHRTSLKSYSPLQAAASSATGTTSQGVAQMRLTRKGAAPQQQKVTQSSADNTAVDEKNVFNATYDVLVDLVQKSDLLSKIMLYQLLIERRMAVPILIPNLFSSGIPYSFHINPLTFTSTKLSCERELNLSSDVELPRVVVISMRSIDQMESISWISQLFSCRSAAYYTQENIRCVLPQQCVAELGIGAFPRYTERQEELIVDETAPQVELLILNIIGDYKPIFSFIVQFADVLLVEESPDYNSHFESPRELPDRCSVVTWKSDSRQSKAESTVNGWNHLYCTLMKTVDEVRYFIQGVVDDDQQMKTRVRAPLTCFQFPSLYRVHALDLHNIESVVKKQEYTRLRAEIFQLQKLFVEEAVYRKKINEDQSDQVKIHHALQKVNELVCDRQIKASQSAGHELIVCFLHILRQEDDRVRALGMHQITRQVEIYSGRALTNLARTLEYATNQYKKNQQSEDLERKFFEAKEAYASSVTRVEHLWREVSHIYTADPVQYSFLADVGAQHLLDGFPLELLDGDAGLINEAWIKGVISRLNGLIMRQNNTSSARIFVISVLGVQSTGKSTLLNHMFGTRLRTSAGQCTRGVYMQLIKCENRAEYDYTLILDTEGMRAPEFTAADSAWHDNRLASFSILPADASIVLINNEEDTSVREIIPIVLLTYQQSSLAADALAEGRNKLVFVFMRNDQNDKKKLKDSKDALFLNLKKAAVDIQKNFGGSELISPLLEDFRCDASSESNSDAASDIKSIGKLKKSDLPPNDVPDKEYGRAVVSLLEYIHLRVVTGSKGKWKARTLGSFIDYMNVVWKCIDSADFTLSFKTVRDKWSYESLQQYCNEKIAQLAAVYAKECDSIEMSILLSLKPVTENAEEICKEEIKKYQSDLFKATAKGADDVQEDFVKGLKNHEEWKPWHPETNNAWERNFEEQRDHSQARIKELITSRIMYDGALITYKKAVRGNITSAYEQKSQSQRQALLSSEEKQKDEFKQMFEAIMTMAKENTRTVNVEDRVSNIYQDIGITFNVKEKYLEDMKNLSSSTSIIEVTSNLLNRFLNWVLGEKPTRSKEDDQNLRSLIAKIENLLSNSTVYSDNTVIKARDLTNNIIDKTSIKLWQRAHQYVFSILVQRLSRIQEEWERKHFIPKRLLADRDELWNHYVRTINGINGTEMLTSDLKEVFSKHWRTTFCNDICTYIVNQRVGYLPWLTDSRIMMAYVDLQLLEWDKNNKVAKLIEKVAGPAQHYKDRVNELLHDEINLVQQDRWSAYRKHLFNIIDGACVEVVAHRNPDCAITEKDPIKIGRGRSAKFLSYIHTQLSLMGKHAKTFADSVGAIVPNESCDNEPDEKWKAMRNALDLTLPCGAWPANSQKPLTSNVLTNSPASFSQEEMQEMVQSIHNQFAKKLSLEGAKPRCAEACPQCGTPCSKQYLHENKGDKLHDCEHQARGLVGTKWSKKSPNADCLVYQSCSNLVEQNCSFEIDNEKSIPYLEFSKHYPEWKQPDPLTTYGQETRQYIFAKYQKNIASYHKKNPCVDMPASFSNHDPLTIEQMLRYRISSHPSV